MKQLVAIGMGSNLGVPSENVKNAFASLTRVIEGARLSPLYSSKPMYLEEQPRFVNAVAVGKTSLAPEDLLAALKKIEKDMGRMAGARNGPRTIDLDILLYGDNVLSTDELIVPHPRMIERPFVLQPLLDLLPGAMEPITNTRFSDILSHLRYDSHDLCRLA
jgi:2-amino-4-hydroxy-6-hydroxymethyldihydropteridine diphosphokinase